MPDLCGPLAGLQALFLLGAGALLAILACAVIAGFLGEGK